MNDRTLSDLQPGTGSTLAGGSPIAQGASRARRSVSFGRVFAGAGRGRVARDRRVGARHRPADAADHHDCGQTGNTRGHTTASHGAAPRGHVLSRAGGREDARPRSQSLLASRSECSSPILPPREACHLEDTEWSRHRLSPVPRKPYDSPD